MDLLDGQWPGTAACAWKTCTEADLRVVARPVRGGLPGLVTDLLRAVTPLQREHRVRAALQTGGFEWLSYVAETLDGERRCATLSLTTYAPRDRERCNARGRHPDVDPRVSEASRSGMPLVWHWDGLDARARASGAAAGLRWSADEMRRSGIRSGVQFVIACADAQRTVIDLMSARPAGEGLSDTELARALMLGFSLHEFYTRHTNLPALLAATRLGSQSLPAVQREIAGQLLQGRSDKEIAALLHLSCHTVDYHMRQLRQRFSARNRVQIVSALRQATHTAPAA